LFLSHCLARDQYQLATAANRQIQAWTNFQSCKIVFASQNWEEGEMMWNTQDEGQGIFQILKSTEEKLHLRLTTLENEVSAARNPTPPPIQIKEKASGF